MNTEEQQSRIDDYLRGRSSDPPQFERDLENDPQLREELDATRLAVDAIHLTEDTQLKERLRRLEAGMTATPAPAAEDRVVPLHPRSRRRWMSYAAAAALILFISAYFLLRPAPPESLIAVLDQVEPFPNLGLVVTKSGKAPNPKRVSAYAAYEAGDFPLAEARFNTLTEGNRVDRFYLAQSLLAQRKYNLARALFGGLSDDSKFQLTEESVFYGAVARLGLGETRGATATLEKIAALPGHPMRAEAATLLSKLK